MQKRKRFTKEFKLEALRLMEESGKPAAEIARELGVRRNQLYKWQKNSAPTVKMHFPAMDEGLPRMMKLLV